MFLNEVYSKELLFTLELVLFCLPKKEPKKGTRNQLLRDCGKQLCGTVVHSDLSFSNSILSFEAI